MSDINIYTLIDCVDVINEFKNTFYLVEQTNLRNLYKNIIFGKFVGKDDFGNKYYVNKKDERWVIYSDHVENTKITSDWFLWMHHTIDKIPSESEKKYKWQKKHKENKTGSNEAYKPIKIKRALNSKDMSLGNNLIISIFIFSFCINVITHAEEKILSSPLINLEKLKPSFEEEDPSKIDLTKDEIFEKKIRLEKMESSLRLNL